MNHQQNISNAEINAAKNVWEVFCILKWKRNGGIRIDSNRRRSAKILISGLVLVGGLTCVGWYLQHREKTFVTAPPRQPMDSLTVSLHQESVMVLGGSMAHGWKDPNDDSYLRRAFQSLTNSTNTNYTYTDQTIIGGRAISVQQNNELPTWLSNDKPNIVVISWGLLDDSYDKTPIDQFSDAIHDEIAQSLSQNAVVLIVTPPVVQAAATNYHAQVEAYIDAEFNVAASFHNGNIYCFNLNDEMSKYMTAHGQTWQQYKGDVWHPNQAGHELAGNLLYNDLIQIFGTNPIQYETNIAPAHWTETK